MLKLSNDVAHELISFVRDVANMDLPEAPKTAAVSDEAKDLAEKVAQQMVDHHLLGADKKAQTVEALCDPNLTLRYTKKALDLLVDEQTKSAAARPEQPEDGGHSRFSMGRPAANRGAVEKTSKDRLSEAGDAFAQAVLNASGRG